MEKTISAENLVKQVSEREQGHSTSILPNWLVGVGGGVLLIGGLGYLWHRRSTGRGASIKLTDEQFYNLHFKIENRLFLQKYVLRRRSYSKVLLQIKQENQGAAFDLMDENNKHRFLHEEEENRVMINAMIANELKLSEYPQLTFEKFEEKRQEVMAKFLKKMSSPNQMTPLERKFLNTTLLNSGLLTGLIPQAFQRLDVGDQAVYLEHRECLEMLVNYELKSSQAYLELLERLDAEGVTGHARTQAFFDLVQKRLKMEILSTYSALKLGDDYAGLSDDDKYHPLLLFLHKALSPPPSAQYDGNKISSFYRVIALDFPALVQDYFTKPPSQGSSQRLKGILKDIINEEVYRSFLQKSGLNLVSFND